MLFDKMSNFAGGLTVPTTANANTYSKVLDLRRNGELGIDGGLKIYGQVVGTPNSTGSVTTVVQTSADGASWTDLASQTQDGNLLIGMFLPFGLKRFVRLKFAVGGTALGSAVKVKAGLVDQFDQGALPGLQSFPLSQIADDTTMFPRLCAMTTTLPLRPFTDLKNRARYVPVEKASPAISW